MTFDDVVDRLTSQFDVTEDQAVAFVNERLGRMVGEAEFMMVTKSLGTTVAAQANYPLAADLVDLAAVKIVDGDDTNLYYGVSLDDLWRADAGDGTASGFAIDYQADGDPDIRLSPAPETAGLDILGLYAQLPSAYTYGGGTVLPIPADVHPHLLAGGRADCYDEEGRQDLAAKDEQLFQTGIGKLNRRKNSRGDSIAPQRMAVVSFDWS